MPEEPEAETRAARTPAPARRPDQVSGSLVGRTILHYRILEKLGQGGMGVVYKAEDEKLARTVALKFLPPDALESADERARLMREARAAASLDHPGICTVHDVEESDGQIFISMAHVEGESLKETIDSGTEPSLDEALDLVSQVADALASAHSKGVVHRDVKPANIMVSPGGRTKVMDFGLAKLSGGTKLTQTGAMMGTVAYMSPEQARGVEADQRTDIWSLGVVLYELVSGELPFRGEYSAALLYSILNEEPAPVTSLRPGLPVELDRVLAKALAKDPGERYQTAGEFREELERLRVGSPVSAPAVRRRRKAGQRLLAALGALVIVLAVVIGLDIGGLRGRLTGGGGPGRIASLAVLPVANLSGDPDQEYFADGMTDALIARLGSLGGLERVTARHSVMLFKGTDEPLREIARQLKVEALVEASVLRAGGEVQVTARLVEARTDRHLWSETYKRDLSDVLSLLNEVTASIAQGIDVALSPTEEARLAEARPVDPEVYQLYLRGRQHKEGALTAEEFWKSIECFEKAIEKDPEYAPAHAELGGAYMFLGVPGMGELSPSEAYAKGKAAVMRALGLDDDLAEAHCYLGDIYTEYEWNWAGAEREFRRAIELNPNYALAHSWYGMLLLYERRHEENVAMARRARELDPLSPYMNSSLVFMYCWAGEYEKALEEARTALDLYPDYWLTRWAVGWVYLSQRKYEEAIAKFEACVEPSGKSPDALAVLGGTYGAAGRREEALEILGQLRDRAKQGYIPPAAFATVYAGLGDKDEAFAWLEKAYEERSPYVPIIWAPTFANLHSDPRYEDLLRRVGLPVSSETGVSGGKEQ